MKRLFEILMVFMLTIFIVLCVYFIINKLELKKEDKRYYIDNITINEFVDKFNQNLKNEGYSNNVTLENTYSSNGKKYWIKIEDGIDLVVVPTNDNANPNNDTISIDGLSFYTSNPDTTKITKYLKLLLITNNENLTIKEINTMIDKANNIENAVIDGNVTITKNYEYKGLDIDKYINDLTTVYRIARISKENIELN